MTRWGAGENAFSMVQMPGEHDQLRYIPLGVGAGILLDATLIRGVLAPAAVAILGRWNWSLPRRPARLLRVEPSGA